MSLSEKDLKPCPFCGCDPIVVKDRDAPPLYRPQCGMCGASRGGLHHLDNAIMAWNQRVEPEEASGAGEPVAWRPEVRAFADLMEAQLRANDHKPGWKSDHPEDLLWRVRQEVDELATEVGPGSRVGFCDWSAKIGAEAADVANFAMMIADVCGALPAAPSPPGPQARIGELAKSKADADLCADEWAKEIEHGNALRGMIAPMHAALKKAEQFIVNGVELGFIRLPDPGDPALDTLPAIRAALNQVADHGG